jgi:hypothetical protein
MDNVHHIIPRHEWKRRFGNFSGCNSPDNLVVLTTEQHAQAHLFLFELNRHPYDLIAYETISGRIGKDEATLRAWKARGAPRPKGFKMDPAHKRAISLASMGKPGTRNGATCSPETLRKRSASLQNLSRLTCPNCGKEGGHCAMKRHHFNNCKMKKVSNIS